MKLILTQEVSGLGGPGDVVEVKDGYGRNYLVPRGLGIRWTKGGESQVAALRRGRAVREVKDLGEAKAIAETLSGLSVKLSSRAGEGGRLFGSVTNFDIANALSKEGFAVEKSMVRLPNGPLKQVGEHQVEIALHSDVVSEITVTVVGEAA